MKASYHLLFSIVVLSTACRVSYAADDPFNDYRKHTQTHSPIYVAAKTTGYGGDSLQPYYVCDNLTSGSAMPTPAWHYSCKQSCTDENQKSKVNITRVAWNYVGADIHTYRVTTSKVCYTAHENIWGYCSHTQTITPVATTLEDKDKIPKEFFSSTNGVRGVQSIINSEHAECEYLSDNTKCARDYVITYRPGKTSKKTSDSPVLLNIYSDGIRTKPERGHLLQNEVAWFWNPDDIGSDTECGWTAKDDASCHFTNTSEVLSCPDIGYHYNINTLKPITSCTGTIYDPEGPAPFMYTSKATMESRQAISAKASEGKGDPDINLIKGLNLALETIEESYCSSACDLFSRGHHVDDDHVLDTPIGSWRMTGASSPQPMMVPCRPTEVWHIAKPTLMCHGKNHILVSNPYTKETNSWDTTKDYITAGETCSSSSDEKEKDLYSFRMNMSRNIPLQFEFWTGDIAVLEPPYETVKWVNRSTSYSRNPGWFSKVKFTAGMLSGREDVSSLITTMAADTKEEVAYNKTRSRTIRTMLFDEIVTGIEATASNIMTKITAILGGIPKILALVFIVLLILYFLKYAIKMYFLRTPQGMAVSAAGKAVSFISDNMVNESDAMINPTAPTRRPRSRARQLAREMEAAGI
ncbi:TPA_asm: glycoprotein [birds-foot trefoil-associated virus]|uniref:Glycoprotein n=1 Tax=birds-foot trefoil-associated virus TaxID=3121202 RepID=A0A9Y0T7Y0_9RHAB|nr:TPA_asm: glycoprotein [Bird's-foot trefoil nucleorhabdovirus]